MALAQSLRGSARLYSLSRQLLTAQVEYYDALNSAQRGDMEASDWVKWFIGQCSKACAIAIKNIDQVIEKRRDWERAQDSALNERQKRVLHLLLDAAHPAAAEGLNAEKYMALTGISKATATRDLSALVHSGQLFTIGTGKALRYHLALQAGGKSCL
jgi:Fic family protein